MMFWWTAMEKKFIVCRLFNKLGPSRYCERKVVKEFFILFWFCRFLSLFVSLNIKTASKKTSTKRAKWMWRTGELSLLIISQFTLAVFISSVHQIVSISLYRQPIKILVSCYIRRPIACSPCHHFISFRISCQLYFRRQLIIGRNKPNQQQALKLARRQSLGALWNMKNGVKKCKLKSFFLFFFLFNYGKKNFLCFMLCEKKNTACWLYECI